jgi:hypothetical protein
VRDVAGASFDRLTHGSLPGQLIVMWAPAGNVFGWAFWVGRAG